MSPSQDKRFKKLDGIIRSITMFILLHTYTDEKEAQSLLKQAAELIEKAKAKLISGAN